MRAKLDIDKAKDALSSVSVLPSSSSAVVENRSIISKFLLEPCVNGRIENPSQYLKKVSRRSKYDFDHLLLTQGWVM